MISRSKKGLLVLIVAGVLLVAGLTVFFLNRPDSSKTASDDLGPPLRVTVEADPAEGGQVKGGGEYRAGEEVIVEALPAEGYLFAGWKDGSGDFVDHGKRFQFTISHDESPSFAGDTSLVAVFEKVGEVYFDGANYDCDSEMPAPKLSPEGKYLLGFRGTEFLLYKLANQALLDTFSAGDQSEVKEFHWHPRGDSFLYFDESENTVHLYLVKLKGEKKKLISFDRARHNPDWISLEGLDCRVGWLDWARQGEAVALQIRSEETTCFYLVGLDSKVLLKKELEGPSFLRFPLASGDGRQIAFSSFPYDMAEGENLWLWDLEDNSLRRVTDDDEGDYPFHWVDDSTLLTRVGGIGTGGGNIYGLASVDLKTGKRRMLDQESGRMNAAGGISPQETRLIGVSCTHGGDNTIYVLDLEKGRREVIEQGFGLTLPQVLWQTEEQALAVVTRYKDGNGAYSICHYIQEREFRTLMESAKRLQILGIRDGVLHYLESTETGTGWIWRRVSRK